MRQRMAGCIEALQFNAATDADDVAGRKATIDTADLGGCAGMGHDACAGGLFERVIAGGVIGMIVGVDDLRDGPAARLRGG